MVDRRILACGIAISFALSYLLFLRFFKERIGPFSRVTWRTVLYWREFTQLYDTRLLQRDMTQLATRMQKFHIPGIIGYAVDEEGKTSLQMEVERRVTLNQEKRQKTIASEESTELDCLHA